MESELIGVLFTTVLVLGIAFYPFIALGRIWHYSARQLAELKRIRAALEDLPAAPR